ncbi:hypothetical protein [Arthrobacter sp. H20]|uniref:hypothetical protein n=1 Tax=Arthrobacter sp. H20 TaxID=1267981 RepID=UPI00047AEA4F|nr:hypothetical protein [Arthrobacter sp. H20]
MSRRGPHWAAAASLGAVLLLAGCGAPELEPEAAEGFQASVREIATAAAAGDQAGATQLATELSQSVAVAQGQGTVTSDRAAQIQSTIDELLLAIAAELGQPSPGTPVPEPTTEVPAEAPSPEPPAPEPPAEVPAETTTPPTEPSDDRGAGDEKNDDDDENAQRDVERELEKAQRDAERELEKQQREQEKLKQEQREDGENN